MSEHDLRALIQRAKAGDRTAFSELYRTFFAPVYRYIYFRVRSRQEAEDITQNVFIRTYQSVARYEEQGKHPLAYFMAAARNAVISHWRRKREVLSDAPEDAAPPDLHRTANLEHEVDDRHEFDRVSRAMEQLTDDQREVLTLKFVSELSNREIARLMDKREDAVRQIQVRGLAALRNIFKHRHA